MARTASEKTLALRNLFQKHNFDVSYKFARESLAKLGIEMEAEPNEKFDADIEILVQAQNKIKDGVNFDESNKGHHDWVFSEAVKSLDWSERKAKAVHDEINARDIYKRAKQTFETMKSTYKRVLAEGGGKPVSGKTTDGRVRAGANVAKATGRKAKTEPSVTPAATVPQKPSNFSSIEESISYVKGLGGLAAVKKLIEVRKAEIASMEVHVAAVSNLVELAAEAA